MLGSSHTAPGYGYISLVCQALPLSSLPSYQMKPPHQKQAAAPAAIPYSSGLQDKGGKNRLCEGASHHITSHHSIPPWLLSHFVCPQIRVPPYPMSGILLFGRIKTQAFWACKASTKEGKLLTKQGRETFW